MKGIRYKLNIDKLEVCYIAPKELIDSLEDTSSWEREGYRLQEEESNKIETVLRIEILCPEAESGFLDFARLRIGNKFEKEGDSTRYCWIRLQNRALYVPGREYGELASLYWIEEDLGLTFNNITEIELALDSTINWFKRVKSAIRNEELTPIVLGRAYPDKKDIISKVLYIHTADRERYRSNTLVVKSGDMSLKLYNKGEEIEESGKGYIRECFGVSGNMFRSEIRANNRALSDFAGGSQYDIYMRLLDRAFLLDLYLFYSNKLLRFREKRSQVSIVQL